MMQENKEKEYYIDKDIIVSSENIEEAEDLDVKKKHIIRNENILFSKKEIKGIIIYIVLSVIAIVLINNMFFSKAKESALVPDDEISIIFPAVEERTGQVFCVPTNDIYGLKVYMTPDQERDSHIIIDMLALDGTLKNQWVINSSDIVDSYYYMSLEGLGLSQGENYYLDAWSDEASSIGICVGKSADYGYGSAGIDGINWVYSILYSAFTPYVYSIEISIVLLGLIAFLFYKKKVDEGTILSVIFCGVAIIFFMITPYNSLYDEEGHFLRAFEISEGHLVSGKAADGRGITDIPDELYRGVTNVTKSLDINSSGNFMYVRQENLMEHNLGDDFVSVDNPNQALYSPASYIPQSIGLALGRLFTKNVFLFYGFGRFFAFLFNTLLVIGAIKLMPDRKMLILAVAMNPVSMAQMVSYSADGLLNSITVFYVAYIFMVRNKEKANILDMALIFIMSNIIALSKVIYFPFVLLVLLITDKCFKTKVQSNVFKVFTLISSVIVSAAWFMIAKSYLFGSEYRGVRPKEQFEYLLCHFYLFPQIVFNTISKDIVNWSCQMFGGELGKGKMLFHQMIWLLFGIIIIIELFTARKSDEKSLVGKKDIIIVVLALLTILGLTFSSLYVQWTTYMLDYVLGIQGRYFIPLILPLGIILKRRIVEGKESNRIIAEVICLLFAVMMAVTSTIHAYI